MLFASRYFMLKLSKSMKNFLDAESKTLILKNFFSVPRDDEGMERESKAD